MDRNRIQSLATSALVLFAGCDATAPINVGRVTVQFEVCGVPTWVAVRNSGSDWEFVAFPAEDGQGSISAEVTPLTTIATGYDAREPVARVYHVSRAELDLLRCEPSGGGNNRTLTGVVSNIPVDAQFAVKYGQRSGHTEATFASPFRVSQHLAI